MLGEESEGELDLRAYLRVLRRRGLIIVITAALLTGMTLAVAYLQTPVYAARARMLIEPRSTISPFEGANAQFSTVAQSVATEIQVVEGEPVQAEVRRLLGSAPPISASQIGTTAVVSVTAESADPERAAEVANAYVGAYITHRRQEALDASLAAQNEVQSKIDDLQDQIGDLDGLIAAGQGTVDSLQAQRQAYFQQQALFKQTLDQLQVSGALFTGGAQVVRSAAVPTSPIRPTPMRNGVLALIVGLLLGVGLAFLLEYLDDSIETREELERLTGGVPVIGEIPEVAGWNAKGNTRGKSRLVAADMPRSAAAEAYRALRTAIDFIALDHPMGTLVVTSPGPGEGKTTTLANLGITLATAGKRVVIVCCDLRRPRIHEFFGLSNTVGFTSTLLGERPVSAALQAVPGVPRLRILASGPLPPNPSELLSSRRAADVFAALTADSDIVLIDTPPVLPVTDALVLFRHVDAALMIFSVGNTTRKQAAAAIAKVKQVNGPVIGAVLNGVKAEGRYGGYGGYGSYTSRLESEPAAGGKTGTADVPTNGARVSGPVSSNGGKANGRRTPRRRAPDRERRR